ncbi:hypothetical protein SLEP1_g37960 [Rubroshorea leprosula]|uniref:Reverse transcriptase domain-containing protein n=1 Tax=Rubroshorea leprosula TaxID=152421 RepID=A0AAV5KWP4_9ROSI|nr:hypothetical protein SLEP1_g37960 [Rubroshorea leprosula]
MVVNVLLAHGMVKNLHKQHISSCCALKIDLMEAFDFVHWDFVFQILDALGFPPLFINWLVSCITTPKFFMVFNGNLVGYFPGKNGIKQAEGQFAYHPKCAKVKLTHLCFANDLIIFIDGKASSLATIVDTLKSFYSISGLKVPGSSFNHRKTNRKRSKAIGKLFDLLNWSDKYFMVLLLTKEYCHEVSVWRV